ncbi:putative acylesterase/phospholipase RssA [Oxalobacteraceae bacterium GrIS 1.11]
METTESNGGTRQTRPRKNIAIVCQGGGSHAAYAAGALQALLPHFENEDLRLVGISGTSGGAICALLAWYGMLKGGPACATEQLDGFWQSNCARLPGEKLWNDWTIQTMGALPYEILFSPYQWQTMLGQYVLNNMWPASLMGLPDWFSAKQWGREDYFQLDALIEPYVDFDLVSKLGDFCSIPSDIERWQAADLQARLLGQTEQEQARKRRLEKHIVEHLALPKQIAQAMADQKMSNPTLQSALLNWQAGQPDFTQPAALGALRKKVEQVMEAIPQLLLGAVDVGNGEFTAFSSERATWDSGISRQAVLASAALPWLFQAVEIEGKTADGQPDNQQYWDGLFSQNPPIKNFISGSNNARKPDEVWVIQINPINYDVDMLKKDIWDRRNELSGNLSLNQEVAFIGAINKRITALQPGKQDLSPEADKHVQVHRIIMDGDSIEKETGKTLNALSKFDRDPKLEEALVRTGKSQADNFLLMRVAMLEACGNLASNQYANLPQESSEVIEALRKLQSVNPGADSAKNKKMQLLIDETIMQSISDKEKSQVAEPHHALVRWHTAGMLGNVPVSVEGETEFYIRQNGHSSAQVSEIRITSVTAIGQGAAAARQFGRRRHAKQAEHNHPPPP